MNQDRYDLSQLGYDLVRVPDPGAAPDAPRRYVMVRRLPRRVYDETEEDEDQEAGAAEGASPHVRMERLSLSSFDGSFDYSRRQLFTARLTYQRNHIFREFDQIELSPYIARRLAGSLSYSIPYLLPEAITRWNLFARVKLYDEFTPDRRFEQTAGTGAAATTTVFFADQENHGARLTLGLVPFTHRNGHSLQGEVFVDRYRVGFSGCTVSFNCGGFAAANPQVPGSSQNDISIFGSTFEYTYEHLFKAPRFSWKFIPTAEVATKAFGGDLAFRRIFGEIKQHYAFPSGFEIDTSWKAGLVDRRVPVFEEFAMGGGDSLRGFERDDFLGRRFLSAQNDLWIPIPFRAFDRESDLMATLQRDLKVALLLDGGSLSFEEIRDVHFARGVGIGLRYTPDGSPLLISLDFAWGFRQGETKFNPYVSITRRW
jgi:outer membrane translocation and assembly module TamA